MEKVSNFRDVSIPKNGIVKDFQAGHIRVSNCLKLKKKVCSLIIGN